jgi:hypothetical protein
MPWAGKCYKNMKIILDTANRLPYSRAPRIHNAASSFAMRAAENADDAGDDLPVLAFSGDDLRP